LEKKVDLSNSAGGKKGLNFPHCGYNMELYQHCVGNNPR